MTLHNPPVNAIGRVMQEEILRIYNYTNHESDFWVCVLHLVLKTFSVGADIKLFYQSILDKKVADTQETYYDGAQALYDLRFDLGGARTLSVGRPVLSCWSGYLRCGGRGLLWDSGSKARCSRQRRRSGPHPAATGSTRIWVIAEYFLLWRSSMTNSVTLLWSWVP